MYYIVIDMSESSRTKFQQIDDALAAWELAGAVGTPPELVLFRDPRHGVTATMDPFSQWRFGVVAWLSNVGRVGEQGHLANVRLSERLKLETVAHALGGQILRACGAQTERVGPADNPDDEGIIRVVERVDGFAVPWDPHKVIGAKTRHEEGAQRSADEVAAAYDLLRLEPSERAALTAQLGLIDIIAPGLDRARELSRGGRQIMSEVIDDMAYRLGMFTEAQLRPMV